MQKICPACNNSFKAHGTAPVYCSRKCADSDPSRRKKLSESRKALLSTKEGREIFDNGMEKRNQQPYYQRRADPKKRERSIHQQRAEYRKWRVSVIKRDNYTCQKCGKHGVMFQVHHIKEWSKYPELRYEIDNGITLCLPCHSDVHGHSIHTTKTCPICAKVFVPHQMNQKFCSHKCSAKNKSNTSTGKVSKSCPACGTVFHYYPSTNKKYCSQACYWNSMKT